MSIPANMSLSGRPGASLRVWRDYFPNAEVVGADIDREVLFREDRISTYYVDQTSRTSIRDMWAQIGVSEFDLMIDDGLHDESANILLFSESHKYLADNGTYVIEDVPDLKLESTVERLRALGFDPAAMVLKRPGALGITGNNLVMCRKRTRIGA